MNGKICIKCGLMSEKFKNEDEAIKAGWVWGNLEYVNGAKISFSLCPECKKLKGCLFLKKDGRTNMVRIEEQR